VNEQPKQTITVKFIGGSMHGVIEDRLSFKHVPANIMVPVYGEYIANRYHGKQVEERRIIRREVYYREPRRDDFEAFAYRLDRSELA